MNNIPGFNASKASNWENGTVNNNILTVGSNGNVTYSYDCGMGFSETFTLYIFIPSKEAEITLPDSLTIIEDEAFMDIGAFTISIPESVTTIGDRAFYGSGLYWIYIPDSVSQIGLDAFTGCADWLTVYGVSGSYAESWAIENGYPFEAVLT